MKRAWARRTTSRRCRPRWKSRKAVVVVLTAEDRAGLLPELTGIDDPDTALVGQPRQNVMLEAGMALGTGRASMILVQLGEIRAASDFHGLNAVRLTNAPQTRAALRNRLRTAGCAIDETAQDWMTPACGDFESALVAWTPRDSADAVRRFAVSHAVQERGNFELALRAYHFPDHARFYCAVKPPNGDPLEIEPPGSTEPSWHAKHHSALYPSSFPGATLGVAVAGVHRVEWIAEFGGTRRVVATDEFQFA
jgi:hypothetical protein